MAALTSDIVAEVVAACVEGAEEAAGALSRALDREFSLNVGESAPLDATTHSEGDWKGPGLAVVMTFGDSGVAALLPASSGLTPDWVPEPDATGESKLATLAQELSMLLVPDTLMADLFEAAWIEDLSQSLEAATPTTDAMLVPLHLASQGEEGLMSLVWPLSHPKALLAKGELKSEEKAPEEASVAQASPLPAKNAAPTPPTNFAKLPGYSRSLLRVKVPVSVCLASKKQSIDEIVELGPGSIITFEKSCDDLLELQVAGESIAMGDAVKVGEKFGLEVSEIVLPDEQFHAVRRRPAG